MKKNTLLLLAALTVFSTSSLFADWIVPVTSLPESSRAFISKIYPDAQIMMVENDDGKLEVRLSNGVTVDFLMDGSWLSIDNAYTGIPAGVLPDALVSAVTALYPQAMIIEADNLWENYKVKLNNFMEIYVSADGQILGQQFDD